MLAYAAISRSPKPIRRIRRMCDSAGRSWLDICEKHPPTGLLFEQGVQQTLFRMVKDLEDFVGYMLKDHKERMGRPRVIVEMDQSKPMDEPLLLRETCGGWPFRYGKGFLRPSRLSCTTVTGSCLCTGVLLPNSRRPFKITIH